MPTTRSQAAEEKNHRIYDDYPASPSAPTSVQPRNTETVADLPATDQPPRLTSRDNERRTRAPSVQSRRSTASAIARIRQAELEAEEQLAAIRQQELLLQATLVRKRLAADVATIREETDRESVCAEETTDTNRRVSDWIQNTQKRGECVESNLERGPSPPPPPVRERRTERRPPVGNPNQVTFETPHRPRSPTPHRSKERGLERLADTLERMTRSNAPSRQTYDLPLFSGAAGEWLPFKVAFEVTTQLHGFSSMENLSRLRTCLRGNAQKTVSALLGTARDPKIIMRTLEQCYGRPEIIIDQALEDLKKLPRVGNSAVELNSFAINLQSIVTVIAGIDDRDYLRNQMLSRQVIEKLSPHLKSRWCDYAEDYGNRTEPEIITLSEFLMREADRTLRHAFSNPGSNPGQTGTARGASNFKREPKANERNRGANVYATTDDTPSKKDTCYCCGAEHATPQCKKLAAMPISKRWEWAKETRICFLCLNSKHRRFKCKAKRCGVEECRQSHHALLHLKREIVANEKEESVVAASAHHAESNQILLKVCPITITGPNGKEVDTYALLDEGSTVTLVDEEIAGIVGANGPTRTLHIHGVTSSQKEPDSQAVEIEIRGRGQSRYQPIRARTVRNLVLGHQSVRPETLQYEHLRELNSDDVCYANAKPRILVGADNWHLIVTRRLLTGTNKQPAASLTRLGWVLHGSVTRQITSDNATVLHVKARETRCDQNDDLSELVKAHFDIDALGISSKRKPIAADERAKAIFDATAKRVGNRFEVGLPWNSDDVTMPPSYDMALHRLRGIEKKMDRSPSFKLAYTEQVEKLLEKGYASESKFVDDENPRVWYLPHFAVTNPNKPGKTRLVFDAAARVNNTCLNDALLDGPDMLRALYGVLFRFREQAVAVTADIREMFLRVQIRPEDRVAQHFLWRGDDRSSPPRKYVMSSMIFGARSSPFLAHSVRNRNASDYEDTHPLAYRAITENHYMDDWVDSFDSVETAARTIAEVQEVHSKAGFELAGWSSNQPQLLSHIPDEDKASAPKELGANVNACGKTLGVLWTPTTDELSFNTAMHRVPEEVKSGLRTPTKREALSAVMSLFDPLGLLSPYTITAKIMLQGLWKQKIGWDDPLPIEEATIFNEWQADLEYIRDLRLPRCYDTSRDITHTQLHIFCDASEQAYATVAYWRFTHTDGSVGVALVAGKAKVAPMRSQSIPRMELQAGLIGARLAAEIIAEHNKAKPEVILWSDSKTVLHWIRNDTVKYTPYVAHRLSEIAELTETSQWRWVPTAHNVADDATRAGNTQLTSHDRWFKGPAFLYDSEEHWPVEDVLQPDQEEVVALTTVEHGLIDISRFSNYTRLVRTTAHVLAFVDKCRRRATRIEARHLQEAELVLLREAQKDSFKDDLARLKNGKSVDKTSKLGKLDPIYGADRIIRLNGRINAAAVPVSMKEPPILHGNHPLTRLIIRNEHEKTHHIGREQVVNNLRQRYWILRLRPAVRTILRDCTTCKMRRAAPAIPVKGNLPEARLSAYVRPFTNCGIDCFGPVWVTIGRRREKRWGMLFTCLVTRAIHIELIASLSTDSAIMALRRMAARRGWPSLYWTDNGTNFHGSDEELKKAYAEWDPTLREYVINKRAEWRYIDPGAPNQGGAWERMIRTVKSALSVTLHQRAPKEEVLATVIAEVENTVNSRPLTHVSVSPDDAEALTPNHFLIGSATGLPYVGECDQADRKTWRVAQALANSFWARWIREYLPTLTPRGEARKPNDNVKIGDIVVIADGLLPRNIWPRGQVERVFTGPDGVVRSVEVRTRGGIFRRPVKRLIILPRKS